MMLFAEGRFIDVNAAAASLLGYSDPSTLVGRTIRDISPRLQPDGVETEAKTRQIVEAVGRGESLHFEAVHLRADGTEIWVDTTIAPYEIDGRRVLLCAWRDLTRVKQAQQALEAREQLYRSLANGVSALIWRSDANDRTTFYNESWLRFTGRRLEDELGDGWLECVPEEDQARCQPVWKDAVSRHAPFCVEFRLRRADGVYRWMQEDGSPVFDEQGRFAGYIGTCIDITERRVAEEELKRSEEIQQAIFHAQPAAVVLRDLAGRILRINAAGLELFGLPSLSQREGDGILAQELIAPEDHAAVEALRKKVLGGESGHLRFTLIRRDGQRVPVESHGVPLMVGTKVAGAVSVTRDITAEVAAEKSRVEKEVAEAASRAKTDFLARMSHELRTPLSAMLGFARLMEQDLDANDRDTQAQRLQTIQVAGWHLLELINDVLSITRIESGSLELQPEDLALAEIVQACLPIVETAAQEHSLKFDVVIDAAACVRADATRLRQVITNLLSNAVKYNRDGGRIELRTRQADGLSWLDVTDTGQGLTTAQLAHLFEPFNRLGAERSNVSGTGIGLLITRQLVLAMGGRIEVESEPDAGSTFSIGLPVASGAALPAPCRTARASTRARPRHEGPARRVLYIEDMFSNIALMQALLKRTGGWELITAVNGAEGIAAARAAPFDLLLLDMQLPDMSGYDVKRELNRDAAIRDIPCLMVTGNAMPEDQREAGELGFAGFITKPFNLDALLDAMEAAVASSSVAVRG